ncbi:hypothetical protein DENSPDRAFT_872543 [Dentipellis sp. KUC8613]|nr:hypothetical protein DENSPDRAFT_872543 [Dentipellis sp. KUC8613]
MWNAPCPRPVSAPTLAPLTSLPLTSAVSKDPFSPFSSIILDKSPARRQPACRLEEAASASVPVPQPICMVSNGTRIDDSILVTATFSHESVSVQQTTLATIREPVCFVSEYPLYISNESICLLDLSLSPALASRGGVVDSNLRVEPRSWSTLSPISSGLITVILLYVLYRHSNSRNFLYRCSRCFAQMARHAWEAIDVGRYKTVLLASATSALRCISAQDSAAGQACLTESDARVMIHKLEQELRLQRLAAEQQTLQFDNATHGLLEQKSQVQSERDALRKRLKAEERHWQAEREGKLALEVENTRLRRSIEGFLSRQQSSVTAIVRITEAQQRQAKARDTDKDRLLDEASVKVAGLLDRVATLVHESTAKGADLDERKAQLDGALVEIQDLRNAKAVVEEQSADLRRQLQLSLATVEQLTVAKAAVEEHSVHQVSLLADHQGQLDRAHDEIRDLLGVKAALERAFSDRGVLLDHAGAEVAEVVAAKVAMDEACSEQRAQLVSMRAEVEDLTAVVEAGRRQVGLKEALLAERGDDLHRAHSRIEELIAAKATLEEESQEVKGDLAAMRVQVQRLTDEAAGAREQLATTDVLLADCRAQLAGAQQESRDSSVAREMATKESREKSELLRSCRSKLNAAHLEIQLLASANGSIIQELNKVRANLRYAEGDVQGLVEDFAALSAVLSKRNKQLSAKDEECRELQMDASAREASLLESMEEISELRSSKSSMTAAIEELQSELDSQNTEERAIVEPGVQKEQLDEITVQLSEARAEVQRKDVEIATLTSDIELVQADLSASEAREAKTEKKLSSKRQELKEAREKLLELQIQVGGLRAETAFTQTQHSELRNKYRIIRETFLELEAELQSTQTDLADAEAKAMRHAKTFSSLAEKDELIQSLEECILELTGAPMPFESPVRKTEKSYAPCSPSPLGPLPLTPPSTPPARRSVKRSSSSEKDVSILRACVLLREASRSSNIPVPKGSPEDGFVKPATDVIIQDQP